MEAVVSAYKEIAQSLTKASVAVSNYAARMENTTDKLLLAELMANPPNLNISSMPGKRSKDEDSDAEPAGAKGKKKKAKKIKDVNAPKRPPSAYLEFQNAVRQQFRNEDPGMPYSDVLRKIAETWNKMSEQDKKHWTDITARKTAEYETAKANYVPSEDADIPVASASSKAVDATTVSKDGKEYTGKKRGRKSNAEKAAIEAEAAAKASGSGSKEDAVAPATDSKKAKKDKAVKASPATKKSKLPKEPTPVVEESDSSSVTSSSSDGESDESEDSSDEDDEDSDVAVAAAVQPKKASTSAAATNGKSKRKDIEVEVPKSKTKKSKTA